MAELLDQLRARFAASEVQQRTQNGKQLDYVAIDATINRFLDILGLEWDFIVSESKVELTPLQSSKGKPLFLALVQGELSVRHPGLEASGGKYGGYTTHSGVGADLADDPDKAIKTALAEALKKAGHQLGVGLYLWDEEERDLLGLQRAGAAGDIDSLKALVMKRALSEGAEELGTADGVATHFGISVGDLSNVDVLRDIAQVA